MDLYSDSETFPALFCPFLITPCSNRRGHKSALQTCATPGPRSGAEIQLQAHDQASEEISPFQDLLPTVSVIPRSPDTPTGNVQQLPTFHTSKSCLISNIPGHDLLPDCRKSWQACRMSGLGNTKVPFHTHHPYGLVLLASPVHCPYIYSDVRPEDQKTTCKIHVQL